MNVQRVTISMPNNVYEQLLELAGKGKVSKFITEATEAKLLDERVSLKRDPVESFLALGKYMPKLTVRQIKAAINKGRM
ncbi:MAG: hypothetical protein AAB656_00860 [Patescibacteria group bacterium]